MRGLPERMHGLPEARHISSHPGRPAACRPAAADAAAGKAASVRTLTLPARVGVGSRRRPSCGTKHRSSLAATRTHCRDTRGGITAAVFRLRGASAWHTRLPRGTPPVAVCRRADGLIRCECTMRQSRSTERSLFQVHRRTQSLRCSWRCCRLCRTRRFARSASKPSKEPISNNRK